MSAYVHVVGNLGRSAELKRYDNGFVLSFSLASSDPKKNTTWFRCSMWGKRAEALESSLVTGTRVSLHGELTSREWTKGDGSKQASLEIRVNDLQFVGKKTASSQPIDDVVPF